MFSLSSGTRTGGLLGFTVCKLSWLMPLLLLFLTACSGQVQKRIAAEAGFAAFQVQGDGFRHQVYTKHGRGNVVHFYLEGDGRPWLSPGRISLDPTSRQPLMLRLMTLDEAPAVYLGRPCYMGVVDDRCSPVWWTSNRYAPDVVQSLSAVIDQFSGNAPGIALFGHSGGGTLAMLLAGRRSDVNVVVTIAGNLDIQAWTQEHGYSALAGSLNPADQIPLASHVRQYHLVGSEDHNVSASLIQPVILKQVGAALRVVEGYDHSCCWNELWPEVLTTVTTEAID
ncbi:MAG: pimeloyl-ACP methyl ester carboxylesterase [Halioglobus sp.]